ncbi:MAG TPA: hypothetical protein VFZ65_15300 [Planctomycetota bacterium]|nr:hypothetical protein [Planctomycetota bacterium]
MNAIRTLLTSLLLGTAATAQLGLAVAPSGQPALAAIRPTLENTIPLPVVEVAGNPNFQIHAAVVTPAVPVGSPMFLLLGPPAAAPIAVPPPLLFPGYGLPGFLGMSEISLIVPMTVAGTFGTPSYHLPIPPGLGALGHCLTAQIAVFVPGGIGLTGATGIAL